MKSGKTFHEIDFKINVSKNLGIILTAILGAIAYYQFVITKDFITNLIIVLIAVVVILVYFLVLLSIWRYKTMRKYNTLVDEYGRIEDNRDTLKKMVKNKNKEIDNLNDAGSLMKSQAQMLIHLAYHEGKPSKEIVMESLSIEQEEVDSNEG